MPDKGWQRRFDEPIPLPKGKKLVTLRDAALYITKLRVFLRINQSSHHETAMKIAKIILAGTAALTFISSAALAQQALTGTVTEVDRISHIVAIKQTQSGATGANNGGAAEEYKAQDSLSLDNVHVGDKVTFSATEAGGIKTITKLQNQ
jgi:Cu/Ag efflux protein CusF